MKYYTTQVAVPQSFVTKGKQRLKQYTDTVYLNNGDEFEIELYNPTTNKILAKIELNGNSIGSGIVLRPGERVYLERYLNESRKFLFETYKVNGKDNEVKQAIMNNGVVTVKFHNEDKIQNIFRSGLYNPISYTNDTFIGFNNTTLNSNFHNRSFTTSGTNSLNNTVTMDSFGDITYSTNVEPMKFKKSKSIETGRVEMGSKSNQSFSYDTTTFNLYASHTTTWKILPNSEKVITKEDLVIYCTECGSKRKKDTFKFCPHCGTKF